MVLNVACACSDCENLLDLREECSLGMAVLNNKSDVFRFCLLVTCVLLGLSLSVPCAATAAPIVKNGWALDYLSSVERPEGRGPENLCGPYAVWHLLSLLKRPETLDALTKELDVSEKGCTIKSIGDFFERRGYETTTVIVTVDDLRRLRSPAIVMRSQEPEDGGAVGHFQLFVPANRGRFYVLDGPLEPLTLTDANLDKIPEATWYAIIVLGIQTRSVPNPRQWSWISLGALALIGTSVLLSRPFFERKRIRIPDSM